MRIHLHSLAFLAVGGFVAALPASARAADPLLNEIEGHFHGAVRWFGMVGDLRFERTAEGDLIPRFDTERSWRVLRVDPAGQSLSPRLPPTADGVFTIALQQDPLLWVQTVEVGAVATPVEVSGGMIIYRGAVAGGDLLYKLTPTHQDEYVYLRSPPPFLRRSFEIRTGPDVQTLHDAGDMVEVVGRDGVARLRVSAPLARAADGTRRRGTIHVQGDTLVEELDLRGLAAPILVDPDWTVTGTMTVSHWAHAAWLRSDGTVMVAGGAALTGCPASFAMSGCGAVIAETDIWSASTGTWTVGPPLTTARYSFASAALPGGDFLVAGGCTVCGCGTTTPLAERYSSATGKWSAAGSLSSARANAMAAALPGGDVLVAGGCDAGTCTADAERYHAATNTWSEVTPLPAPRGFATSTVLADGRVLLTGGCSDAACTTILDDAAVYDPTSDSWAAAGTMSAKRAGHTATLLGDGTVLVAGGCSDSACKTSLASADLWSPGTGAFSALPPMNGVRHNQTATLLETGEVLIAGGIDGTGTPSAPSSEVYVPSERRWVDVGDMAYAGTPAGRAYHTAVRLASGDVLVAGGCNASTCFPYAELYSPAALASEEGDGGPPKVPDSSVVPDAPPLSPGPFAAHPSLYRTGITSCATESTQDLPCPVAGYPLEDGDFQPNARSFTTVAGGDLRDDATGLTWQATDDGKSYDYASAVRHCATLATPSAGAGAWRLPSIVELMSIVDYGVDGPSIDGRFVGTQPTYYWTSTHVASEPTMGWAVKFDAGESYPMLTDTPALVRCVRGGRPAPDASGVGSLRQAGPLTATPDTVQDLAAGLEWQRKDDGVRRSWRDSLAYCAGLKLGGETGWHLATVGELRSIVEYGGGAGGAAIDPVFQDPKADLYWTSSQNEGAPTLSWSVSFGLGTVDGVPVGGLAYARCVRHLAAPPAPASPGGCGCSIGGARAGREIGGETALALVLLIGVAAGAGRTVRRRRRSRSRRSA